MYFSASLITLCKAVIKLPTFIEYISCEICDNAKLLMQTFIFVIGGHFTFRKFNLIQAIVVQTKSARRKIPFSTKANFGQDCSCIHRVD